MKIEGSQDKLPTAHFREANMAAKLCALREGNYASWVTAAVHDVANEES